MTYSSIIENEQRTAQFSEYDSFESSLELSLRSSGSVYLCTTNFLPQIIQTPYKTDYINTLHVTHQIGNYLVLIINSDSRMIEKLATKIHETVKQPVGIIKYEAEQGPSLAHSNAVKALELAKKNGQDYHIYDASKDSVEAKLSEFIH